MQNAKSAFCQAHLAMNCATTTRILLKSALIRDSDSKRLDKACHEKELPYPNAFLIRSNPRFISVREVAKESRKLLSAPNPSPGTTPTPAEPSR